MELRTHISSLHLPLHFWCVSIADEDPTILFWPQMRHYLVFVQLFYLSRFQCDMCTGRDTEPCLLNTTSSDSLRKADTDDIIIFYLHPTSYPVVVSLLAAKLPDLS